MNYSISIQLDSVAKSLSLPLAGVESVVRLLDAGNTVPFITRYRKDQTGGLDEEQIRQIEARVTRLRLLAERKQTILRSIEGQGKLTPELAEQIKAAESTKLLEDLYLPFKPKKQTLATVARERALEPLAKEILAGTIAADQLDARAADFVNPDKQVGSVADALLGVGHILAEDFSERADLRDRLRTIYKKSGKLVSAKVEGADKQGNEFRDYFAFEELLSKVPPHRVLAINRGEKAKFLRVKVDADNEGLTREAEALLVPADHPHAEFLRGCARDALARLIVPSLEREARRELTENAESHAVTVFARNLRNLLLQPPIRGRRVLAIDPGFKSGCKLAVLDEFGSLLDQAVIHLVGKAERIEQGKAKLVEFIRQHGIHVVAIGNGTACRESEELLSELMQGTLAQDGVAYVIVNEAGASVYSTSQLGREEFPEYDATLRGAISIGRRLQDPLSELVKIDPANIGVGMYQHDVKARHLQTSLDAVVESCVNYVGVDLNTASPALLRYVSGLNQLTARRLYDHRLSNGPFKSREQLKDVPGFGEAAFVQAAGFLKISDGENPLDTTWIHPESYPAAERVLERLDCAPTEIVSKEGLEKIAQRSATLETEKLAEELNVGRMALEDIVSQLTRPQRDPREDLPAPIFKQGVLKLDDLEPGMELKGSVLNVVDFGAFVDIGLHDSGLVHVSQLANKYVRDPHEVVSVGAIVTVWVLEVDKTRRRVSLTMIPPGTPKPEPGPRGRRRPEGAEGASDGAPSGRSRGKPRGNRPPRPEGAPAANAGPGAPSSAPVGGPHQAVGARRFPQMAGQRPGASGGRRPASPGVPRGGQNSPRGGQGGQRGGQGGQRGGRGRGGKPTHDAVRAYEAKAKPKPLVPLTAKMKAGKEPLRTFGDLKQFLTLGKEPEVQETPAAAKAKPAKPETPPVERPEGEGSPS